MISKLKFYYRIKENNSTLQIYCNNRIPSNLLASKHFCLLEFLVLIFASSVGKQNELFFFIYFHFLACLKVRCLAAFKQRVKSAQDEVIYVTMKKQIYM